LFPTERRVGGEKALGRDASWAGPGRERRVGNWSSNTGAQRLAASLHSAVTRRRATCASASCPPPERPQAVEAEGQGPVSVRAALLRIKGAAHGQRLAQQRLGRRQVPLLLQ